MRALVQRVTSASVAVDERVVAEIGLGSLILLGVKEGDTIETADALAAKVAHSRIFADESGKMNLSVGEAGGSVLVVSQFTLYADTSRGRRPSFVAAARPEVAEPLVDAFSQSLRRTGLHVADGVFRAHMKVTSTNDGPVTIMFEA